jgi:GTPase SAR1 family protein
MLANNILKCMNDIHARFHTKASSITALIDIYLFFFLISKKDICERDSFQNVIGWREEILRYCSNETIVILVGNKCDLSADRKISYAEGKVCHGLFVVEGC